MGKITIKFHYRTMIKNTSAYTLNIQISVHWE